MKDSGTIKVKRHPYNEKVYIADTVLYGNHLMSCIGRGSFKADEWDKVLYAVSQYGFDLSTPIEDL